MNETLMLDGMKRRATDLLLILFLLLASVAAHAQPGIDTARDRSAIVQDSIFRLVGTSIWDMRAVRELRLDYARGYNAMSAADVRRVMRDPTSGFDIVRGRFYRDALREGLPIINPITDAGIDLKNLRVVENYAKVDPVWFHNLHFTTIGDWGIYDTVMHGLAYGVTVPAMQLNEDALAAGGVEILVASGPTYNSYWALHRGDSAIYGRIGLPDRSTYFRASVAIKVDTAENLFHVLRDDDVIARMVLYRRAHGGQEDCRCGIYEPFDTLSITKRFLLDSTEAAEGAPGYRDAGVTFDAALQGIALHRLNASPWINGDGFSWFGYPTCSPDICREKLLGGGFAAGSIAESVELSDLNLRLYSTGRVPITFLRSRVNQDLYDQLRARRLDSILRRGVRELLRNDTLRRLIGRLPYSDESTFHKVRSDGVMARKLQELLQQEGDSTLRLWSNPPENFAAFRVLTGDLDRGDRRTIHLMVRQDYKQIGASDDPIPIYYANPDSMSSFGTRITYGGMIAGHGDSIYTAYTARRQRGFGAVRDAESADATFDGPLLRSLVRLVDVAKFRYRAVAPEVPVWNTIQDYGLRGNISQPPEGIGTYYTAWWLRPPTPEEITAQCWLSLNCGVDGLVYADLQYDGHNFGPLHTLGGIPARDYDSLHHPAARRLATRADSLKYFQPLIWTGFRGRYEAIRKMNEEIRRLDSIIHLAELRFNREQISVHDARQSFAAIPLVDTVMAERARRHERDGSGGFIGSDTIDARRETYIDLTHFMASPRDPRADAHYLLLTNRRCWPVDMLRYGDSAKALGAHAIGLGAIDVRRPIIVLKRLPEIDADTFLIEKVGDDGAWPARRAAVGELIELDWLTPGWGAFYRVTPVATP